jgi:hypothetical protein
VKYRMPGSTSEAEDAVQEDRIDELDLVLRD